jgi:hypothetical protein
MGQMGEYVSLQNSAAALTDLEICKRVARHAKGGILNVMVKLIEPIGEAELLVSSRTIGISGAHSRRPDIQRNLLIRVEQKLGERFMAEHFL